ncbi:MAG: hypothetical protein HOV77_21805 [Hamadaea sp.]|uniref:hypothetical protein n=1 Tax=Hamadaea sp. TaxID=2024425 RepID=UPI0018460143|nr:hypothetical protein [Hamadaea sp.]NUT21819.1 hypothetical protein [Hamadaea sp.]
MSSPLLNATVMVGGSICLAYNVATQVGTLDNEPSARWRQVLGSRWILRTGVTIFAAGLIISLTAAIIEGS